jgi:hypothetical protein
MSILTELVREGFIDGDTDGFKDIYWVGNAKMRGVWHVSNEDM